MLKRLFKHLILPAWWWQRKLPLPSLRHIEDAVGAAESGHSGEVRVAVETSLDLGELLQGMSARERAIEVFASLRVWDTEDNNGVLLYVLLADRDVEIVADRGIAARVAQSEWEVICQAMETQFRLGRHEEALLTGVKLIGEKLAAAYPGGEKFANQLPNKPVVIR